ncbi:MAG: aminoacetone oxidase family FAD-binding enzyme [Proteobacteria bacterium]|nr:aminoacetone oxidase family FAD-binding enzyme [Pseudomonadota bacterium]
MSETKTEICIVGAGAAGLWAAAACARAGMQTLVLEKTPRTGSKVLSSGGSRCNLTTTLEADQTARHFGHAHDFIRPALRSLTPQGVRSHFEALGVRTKVEPEFEKVFPASDSALEVRNALQRDAREAGAVFRLGSEVVDIEPHEGGWVAHLRDGRVLCERLLLCTGGKSFPKTGTTGDGYPWLRRLGLKVVDPVPALVPLASPAAWIHDLSGISVDGELRFGKRRRRRPVLFTHKGLSGPGPMDLSDCVTRGGLREARLDLVPDISWEQLRAELVAGAGRPGSPRLASILPLPRRLVETVARQAGLADGNPRLNQIPKAARHRLIDEAKGLRIPISGSLGFSKAEVTAGGLALSEVDRGTMEVRKTPGLFVFGELLDLTGPIGGFNFQAAFSTAALAARAASKR